MTIVKLMQELVADPEKMAEHKRDPKTYIEKHWPDLDAKEKELLIDFTRQSARSYIVDTSTVMSINFGAMMKLDAATDSAQNQ